MDIQFFVNKKINFNPFLYQQQKNDIADQQKTAESTQLHQDRIDLVEKKIDVSNKLNKNNANTSKLFQKKHKMNKQIQQINHLITKLNSQKMSLKMKSLKYNLSLSNFYTQVKGSNLDINI